MGVDCGEERRGGEKEWREEAERRKWKGEAEAERREWREKNGEQRLGKDERHEWEYSVA